VPRFIANSSLSASVARVIKRCQRNRVVKVVQEVLCGAKAEVISLVIGTQRSLRALINTAYIERLNATFRERLAPLARRTRAGAISKVQRLESLPNSLAERWNISRKASACSGSKAL
jgi:IS1 family transposase